MFQWFKSLSDVVCDRDLPVFLDPQERLDVMERLVPRVRRVFLAAPDTL